MGTKPEQSPGIHSPDQILNLPHKSSDPFLESPFIGATDRVCKIPRHIPFRPAFTLVEVMMVVMILSIVGMMSLDFVANYEAAQRADRAARESLAVFRFARNLARTSGKKAKVQFSKTTTTNDTLSVYWQSNGTSYDATPYTSGQTSGGTEALSMATRGELLGTVVGVSNAGGTVSYIEYNTLGNCNAYSSTPAAISGTTTITYSYGGRAKSLLVANIGDPALQ